VDPSSPGKQSLVQQLQGFQAPFIADLRAPDSVASSPASSPVQRKARDLAGPTDSATTAALARRGVADAGASLPHLDVIQRSFGHHDVGDVRAHQGAAASQASRALGASAYAFGNSVAFGAPPDLHTAAHEAAHVVQQRGGVQLKGGIDEPGDTYECHADAVADRVVAGQSAENLLDGDGPNGARPAVQRKESKDDAAILENQARLKGTDVEIPALEGALLSTRQEAVKRGLLSQASFDAGLALSQAMTQLQPTVAAKGVVDKNLQDAAGPRHISCLPLYNKRRRPRTTSSSCRPWRRTALSARKIHTPRR
jgi:hypothetical protein